MISSSERGILAREKFLSEGKLGQLIDCSTDFAKFVDSPFDFIDDVHDDFLINVYDTKMGVLKEMQKHEIPKTFSFWRKPKTKLMELDYFLRASSLVKHQIIWAKKSIPQELFGLIASKSSAENIGRYTAAPWLPRINQIMKATEQGTIEY